MTAKVHDIPADSVDITPGSNTSLVPLHGTSLAECPTNLRLDTYEGKALAIAAMSPGDIEIGKDGYVEMIVTHYILYPDEGVNEETGEVTRFTRLVLFTAEGLTYRTTSESAPRRIEAMLKLFGPAEWAAGLPFLIRERKSRKTGRTYHDIRLSPNRRM